MLTSTLSADQWWIPALVSGLTLGAAAQSMAIKKRDKLIALSVPLAVAVSIALGSAARGYEGRTPLVLYTAAMIIMLILRLVFAGYISRQLALQRAGKPTEEVTRKQNTIFLLTFLATLVLVAFIL